MSPHARFALTTLVLATLAIGIALMSRALAHSWYDPDCCSGNDCDEMDPDYVTAGPTGYSVDFRGKVYAVPYGDSRIKASQDRQYHACEFPKGTLRCFYTPGGAT